MYGGFYYDQNYIIERSYKKERGGREGRKEGEEGEKKKEKNEERVVRRSNGWWEIERQRKTEKEKEKEK